MTTIFEFIKSYVSIVDVIDVAFISYVILQRRLSIRYLVAQPFFFNKYMMKLFTGY